MIKQKNKTEQCVLCKLSIYLEEDNYCRLTDFFKGKFHGENYYHNKCFTDNLKNKDEMEKMKKAVWGLLNKANLSLDNSGMEVEV